MSVRPQSRRRAAAWLAVLATGAVSGVSGRAAGEDAGVAPPEGGDLAPTEVPSGAGPASVDAEEEAAPKARKRPPKEVRFEARPGAKVYWIRIDEVIDLGLAPFVERVVDAVEEDPDAVLLVSEIHTPGGRVDAAVRIRDVLLESKVPTLAFVHSEAISAGALIALSHDYIATVGAGTIGAATPIQMGAPGTEAQPVEEKMVSYMRSVFRATAEAKGRDPVLAEAMVDADISVPGLAPKGKLLTATATEAHAWGLVDLVVLGDTELLDRIGLADAKIERMETNWAELVARVLTHPVVSGLLMSLGFLGILMEFYTPGFGALGLIGLSLLLLFFLGHYVVHLAGLEELGLFVLGVVLLGLEVFVTPGFGVLGVLGLVAIVASLVLTLIAHPLDVSIDTGELGQALLRVFGSVGVTLLVGLLLVARFARSGPFKRLVLADEVAGTAVGFGADAAGGTGPEAPTAGAAGVAKTSLRPSGKVVVAGRTFDAVTAGPMIEKGTPVEVRGTRGSSLVVRGLDPAAPREGRPPGEET